jgi:universal stress protein A
MEGYHHILLATDLSDSSDPVAERAADTAERHNARLSLAHIVEQLPVDYVAEGVPIEVPDVTETLEQEARQGLEELAQKLKLINAACWVQVGSARVDIPELARQHAVDLIVVGARERHGLSLLLPSTTSGVLHHAPCDVLAVQVGG